MSRTTILRDCVLALCLMLAAGVAPAAAETPEPPRLEWLAGPGTAPIGDELAEIDVPEQFVFLEDEGTQTLLQLMGNPTSGAELATMAPASDEANWFVIFEWEPIGFVKDDEAGEIDGDAILASLREGTAAANEERRKRGWSTLEIVGWHEEPHYDAQTHNLTWTIIGESQEGRTLNRFVKILGRRGVMTATLVAGPEELAAAIPAVDALLAGYRFRPGNTYAEFVPGKDRLAEIGLTALIAGGAGAALVKSGLLARLWKPIAALGAGLIASVARLFRRKQPSATTPDPIG